MSTATRGTIELELTNEEASVLKALCAAASWEEGEGAIIEGIFDALDEVGVQHGDYVHSPSDIAEDEIVIERTDAEDEG